MIKTAADAPLSPLPDAPQAATGAICAALPAPGRAWQPPPPALRYELTKLHNDFPLKKADPEIRRNPDFGWLLPYLLEYDDAIWGRWDYWACSMQAGGLMDVPIPQIEFMSAPHPKTYKMLEQCLDAIPGYGGWMGWGSSEYISFFLDWLLYGLGHNGQPEPPREPRGCEGASDRLYQIFQLGPMQLFPHDYFGEILSEMAYGRNKGFYPTPMEIVNLMALMTHDPGSHRPEQTVCDPCVGTGRMLLYYSNYSLCLYGQDIDATMCKCTLINGALYAPWLYRPFPFTKDSRAADPGEADAIEADPGEYEATEAPPPNRYFLPAPQPALDIETEADPEAWRFVPIHKKRPRQPAQAPADTPDAQQGILF